MADTTDPRERLMNGNKRFIESVKADNPDFFKESATGQAPHTLWLGCADSRVPAAEVTDSKPGELFVHRNIANVVVHTDFNFLSVLQYAVEVLKVKQIV